MTERTRSFEVVDEKGEVIRTGVVASESKPDVVIHQGRPYVYRTFRQLHKNGVPQHDPILIYRKASFLDLNGDTKYRKGSDD